MSDELLIFMIGSQWFLIVIGFIFLAYNWIRTGTNERKIDEIKNDLARNYELDDHQETQINLIKSDK